MKCTGGANGSVFTPIRSFPDNVEAIAPPRPASSHLSCSEISCWAVRKGGGKEKLCFLFLYYYIYLIHAKKIVRREQKHRIRHAYVEAGAGAGARAGSTPEQQQKARVLSSLYTTMEQF